MMQPYPGKFILFEGFEGAGKSTQVRAIAERLRRKDYEVVETKEPGCATPKCQEIRKILLNPNKSLTATQELDLFIEDRTDHFSVIVIPALESGMIVLCDRGSPSTIAYQHYGRGLSITEILLKDAKARQNISADLVLLLDIDPEIGLRRKKPETRFEIETASFHQRVRQGYLEQARQDVEKKWVVIDAKKSLKEVQEECWKAIEGLLRSPVK